MSYFSDKIVPGLIGAIIAGLGSIVWSILSDIIPSIMPTLTTLPIQLYIKLIVLLLFLFMFVSILWLIYFLRSRNYKPRVIRWSYSKLKWVAELNYAVPRGDVSIEIQWLCPRHKIFLGLKDAQVPECCYNNLFCKKCNHVYELSAKGDAVYLEEAERIIRKNILRKIRIA